ncbi:hypothetical protein [Candidatus Binatus sp.]|uniref:hypothetical protein n=1 Tax=Candidatus Binatus sp. TaxID=2811406 RepID=UPI003C760FF2
MRTRIFILCCVICVLGSIGIRTACAQTSLEVPGPANQNQPYVPPRPAPPPVYQPDNGDTIQLLPQLTHPAPTPPPPAPAHVNVAPMTAQAVPVLPAVFHGCWQGQVNELDWIRREPGAHKIGFWTPKTYRLCYKQVGDQPFKLTFTETGVELNDKIINARGEVVPLATDGRAYATMRSRLSFDEYRTHFDGSSPTFAVDEGTNLDCRIAGDDMLVSADVYGTRDGTPWFRAHWRADFHKFEN